MHSPVILYATPAMWEFMQATDRLSMQVRARQELSYLTQITGMYLL